MQILVVVLAFALLGVVLFIVSAPLRAADAQAEGEPEGSSAQRAELDLRAELEAEREAKYREIRDTELDLRTGKLSREDYAAIDGALRGEALAILDRLQELDAARESGARDGEGS